MSLDSTTVLCVMDSMRDPVTRPAVYYKFRSEAYLNKRSTSEITIMFRNRFIKDPYNGWHRDRLIAEFLRRQALAHVQDLAEKFIEKALT